MLRRTLLTVVGLALVAVAGSARAASNDVRETLPAPHTDTVRVASQGYFKAVTGLLDDLQQQVNAGVSNGEEAALYSSFAQKIDRLPILNIDQDLQSYGADTANQLRSVGVAIQDTTIQAGNGAVCLTPTAVCDVGYSRDCNPHSLHGQHNVFSRVKYDLRNLNAQIRVDSSQTDALASGGIPQMLSQIQQSSAQVRREMTNKYQVEF